MQDTVKTIVLKHSSQKDEQLQQKKWKEWLKLKRIMCSVGIRDVLLGWSSGK